MASEEKKLSKEVTVKSNQKPKSQPTQRAYRGLSTGIRQYKF